MEFSAEFFLIWQFYSQYDGVPSQALPEDYGGFCLARLREIANRLYLNENPPAQPYPQKCVRPSDAALAKMTVERSFPWIDTQVVIVFFPILEFFFKLLNIFWSRFFSLDFQYFYSSLFLSTLILSIPFF
jgi:hypothetical protein